MQLERFPGSQGRWRGRTRRLLVRSTSFLKYLSNILQVLGASGFLAFVAGMVLYTWIAHKLITAIANTIVATVRVCTNLNFMFVLN